MPSFNGNSGMFGAPMTWEYEPHPVAVQQNAYAGLSGTEELVMGQRGAVTAVTGWLAGSDRAALKAVKVTWWSYYDGNAYVLVDAEGDAWQNVKLESIRFPPKMVRLADGSSWQRYEAKFRHQTNT